MKVRGRINRRVRNAELRDGVLIVWESSLRAPPTPTDLFPGHAEAFYDLVEANPDELAALHEAGYYLRRPR